MPLSFFHRRPAFLVVVWAGIFLLAGEAVFRLAFWADRRFLLTPRAQSAVRDVFQDPSTLERSRRISPTLVYKNTPNHQTARFKINSRGFRGAEFSPSKKSGERRVICAGDSCTFGWEVGDGDTYPALLQKGLERSSREPVTVINAGVPGYSSWQVLTWCREELFSLNPDVLILYVGWNDLFEAKGIGQRGKGDKMLAYLFRKSLFISEIHLAVNGVLKRFGRLSPEKEAALYAGHEPLFFRHQMESLLREAREKGIQVLLLTLATPYEEGEPSSVWRTAPYIAANPIKFKILHDRYNDTLRSLSRDHSVPSLDLALLLKGRSELFGDFCHPNAKGNAVIADRLSPVVQALLAGQSQR
jgi:lysophospholipase L1-like esterase